jgi:ribosomal protein S18 acetylase RimI-like enzyme
MQNAEGGVRNRYPYIKHSSHPEAHWLPTMTAFHVATQHATNSASSGIRPFDIGRDLRPVAELIADAFAHELDSRGSAALREMRIMSHVGGVLRLLNRSTGEFDDLFGGFVWVEEGQVVGNVTVQRADREGSRWQIANVAVAPPFRGRGISRRLMGQALEHIREHQGRWAVLQVYERNIIARNLYAQMDFEVVGGSVDLRLDRLPVIGPVTTPPSFGPFPASQWQPLYELANLQYGAQAQWWRALRRVDFQLTFEQQALEWLGRLAGRNRVYRRSIQTQRHHFDAALVLTAMRWRGAHHLQFWVRPEQYGSHEALLLEWALATLSDYPRWPVNLTLNSEHTAALTLASEMGFRTRQTLLTMRRKIEP